MSIAEYLKDSKTEAVAKEAGPAPRGPAPEARKLRKQVFGISGSVIVLGLALAGWYVAYRIGAERGTRASSAPAVTIPVPGAVPAAIQPAPAPPSPAVVSPARAPVAKIVGTKPVAEVIRVVDAETKPVPEVAAHAKPVKQAESATHADAPVRPATPVRRVPFERHDANPQHGEKYLQIAAYGPKSLDDYLKRLEAQGRHPLVAPGPAENIFRILVGPFKDADALEQARRSIQAMGIEPILRSY